MVKAEFSARLGPIISLLDLPLPALVADEFGRLTSISLGPSSSTSYSMKKDVALVVANKPIPLSNLRQEAENRQTEIRGGLARQGSKQMRALAALNRDTPSKSASPRPSLESAMNAPPAFAYYFEVAVNAGEAWVGLVPAESVVTPEQHQFMLVENGENGVAATKPNPFPILMQQLPGRSPDSIGLGNDGQLYVGGSKVTSDEARTNAFMTKQNDYEPWTKMTPPNESVETIGCGWEIGGQRKVFFTRNGKILHSDRRIVGFEPDGHHIFPSVGMLTEGTDVVANFGLDPAIPFLWEGDSSFVPITITSDAKSVASIGEGKGGVSRDEPGKSRADGTNFRESANSSFLEDRAKHEKSQYDAVIQKSIEEAHAPRTRQSETLPPMTLEEMEEAKGDAMQLREIAAKDPQDADPHSFQYLLDICKRKQKQVASTLERTVSDDFDYDYVIKVIDTLNISIEIAEQTGLSVDGITSKSPKKRPSEHNVQRSSEEVDDLVKAKDIFSLICLLRSQYQQKVAAAYALLMMVKQEADQDLSELRREIIAFGGINSLLTLYTKSEGKNDGELQMVSALSLAYLLPCFADSDSMILRGYGLRMITCLTYLARYSESNYIEELSPASIRGAAALALYHIWLNSLEPKLREKEGGGAPEKGQTPVLKPNWQIQRGSLDKALAIRRVGGRQIDQRQGAVKLHELLESTISLIIYIANKLVVSIDREQFEMEAPCRSNIVLAVESACYWYQTRPMAVRGGVLEVLVRWLNSGYNGLVFAGAKSLRLLVKLQDSYLSGWIHSQVVSNNALRPLVKLVLSEQVDVRLAVAETVSSLSIAPHTRAAILDNSGLEYLVEAFVQLLADYSTARSAVNDGENQTTLHVGRALLQIAAGAMISANRWRKSDFGDEYSERAIVVKAITDGGAIEPLLKIAKYEQKGRLRLMAVDFLCVISDDPYPRDKLCRAGAAEAFGSVLKEGVPLLYRAVKKTAEDESQEEIRYKMGSTLEELYSALLALANLLEGEPAGFPDKKTRRNSATSNVPVLMDVLEQIVRSGGLESLLILTSLPMSSLRQDMDLGLDIAAVDIHELGLESCRSLSLLCPLLLSENAKTLNVAHWAGDVLLSLASVLKRDSSKMVDIRLREQKLDAMHGLHHLAESEPLKIRIVDGLLSQFLRMKKKEGGDSRLSKAATRVCDNLGFVNGEIDVQLVGNDPKLAAFWFGLERSMLLQAMAREEMRKVLVGIWFHSLSNIFKWESRNVDLEGKDKAVCDIRLSLFKKLGNDDGTRDLRQRIIAQYKALYGQEAKKELVLNTISSESSSVPFSDADIRHTPIALMESESASSPSHISRAPSSVTASKHMSLSSTSDYSLHGQAESSLLGVSPSTMIGNIPEREWILKHQCSIDRDTLVIGGMNLVPHLVQALLSEYFPSKLLQSEVLPLSDLVPDASYNFRALSMPERQYRSFRHEGAILIRVCDKHSCASNNESDETLWTLSFSNSTFRGEFAGTLVTALYRCPIIHAVSFSNRTASAMSSASNPKDGEGSSKEEKTKTILADLAGSLPPWVSSLTFDNVLGNTALTSLINALKAMGQLPSDFPLEGDAIPPALRRKEGFTFMAICNSPNLRPETIQPLYSLLGRKSAIETEPLSHASLHRLRSLDLSGNLLGDESIASLLSVVHDKNSTCSLERLDVSKNNIGNAYHVGKVLSDYVYTRRRPNISPSTDSDQWISPLVWLGLASNNLGSGRLVLDMMSWLENNDFALTSLDLSDNAISDESAELLLSLSRSLKKNEKLVSLDLSLNSLSNDSIEKFIEDTKDPVSNSLSRLAFLGFNKNEPPLNRLQINRIENIVLPGRRTRIAELEAMRAGASKAQLDLRMLSEKKTDGISKQTGSENDLKVTAHPTMRPIHTPLPVPALTGSKNTPIISKAANLSNKVTVLFSAPLVFKDKSGSLRPIHSPDLELERDLLQQVFKEASRDIELGFDVATTNRLQVTMTKGCRCLHFSGHGHPESLTFEDGTGAMQWLEVNRLRTMISYNSQAEAAPFQLVFVSACHSFLTGQTFVNAGVPHVVCCQLESELMDSAALAFTRAFYLALAIGHTVKHSFEIGRSAVVAASNVHKPDEEVTKFVLLPEKGNHNVPIFKADEVAEWPKRVNRSLELSSSARSHLPTQPEGFLGREIEMYLLLNAVLDRRLVNLVGPTGMGRSSLATALCHYIFDRKTDMSIDYIFFVHARPSRRQNSPLGDVLLPLHEQIVSAGLTTEALAAKAGIDELSKEISTKLHSERALIVIDHVENLDDSEDAQELTLFINNLFRKTRHARVLLTSQRPLGLLSFSSVGGVGEYVQELGPLNLKSTVTLFGIHSNVMCSPIERRKFLDTLVTPEEEDATSSDESLSSRSRNILARLGNGVPASVCEVARHMTKEACDDLQEMQS